ncbi:MAG: SCO family protein [Pseudomonadales bacterium]|nr:SCO family protein [Pseudomonadales bacterium]
MDTGVRNTLFGIAAFISVILGLLVASIMMPRPMTAEEAQELGFYRFDAPRVISDFDMTDQAGNPVNLEDLKGQWSILFFGFTTCPDICPTTLSVLADAVADIENPPQVVMVSVDPDRDTPEKLGQYVPAFNPAFRGFVGSFDETVNFAQQVNVAFGKVPGAGPGTYLVDHTASLVLIDLEGRYAGFIKSPHNAQNIQKITASL